jgi:hypothetical protein
MEPRLARGKRHVIHALYKSITCEIRSDKKTDPAIREVNLPYKKYSKSELFLCDGCPCELPRKSAISISPEDVQISQGRHLSIAFRFERLA